MNVTLVDLPTHKPHVSFSEVATWTGCTFKHSLRYVKGLDLSSPSPHATFGTILHGATERYVKHKDLSTKDVSLQIEESWSRNEFGDPQPWVASATGILEDLPEFFDTAFPEWEPVYTEYPLYERIDSHPEHAFKGFIDTVITVPDRRGKRRVQIIDYKTCGWGWTREKKTDPVLCSQLVYYKHFYAKHFELDPRYVRAAFVLLKRVAKPTQRCQVIGVSSGPKVTEHALGVLDTMFHCLKNNIAIKDVTSCDWCDYFGTEHCRSGCR